MNSTAMGENNVACLIQVPAISDVDCVAIEVICDCVIVKCVPAQHVVAVDPRCEKAGCTIQSPIDCVTLARIGFAHAIRQPPRVFLYYFNRIICASSVENQVLEIRVALQENGAEGCLDKLPLIE